MSKNYQGIDLESIQFVNNRNDIVLIFKNVLNKKVIYNRKLVLENIYYFEVFANVDNEYPYLPYYLVELSIDEVKRSDKYSDKIFNVLNKISKQGKVENQYYLVQTVGDLEIYLVCKNVKEIILDQQN